MKNNLHLLMGCPGSGKTTFALTNYDSKTEAYISRDEIRFSLVAENEPYFSKEREVFAEFVRRIINALEDGFEVYADATHLNKPSRVKLLRAIYPTGLIDGADVIWINTPLETCLERNAKRTGRSLVPEDQIKKMFSKIEKPTFEEGFNTIYVVEEISGTPILKKYEKGKDDYE